MNTFILCLGLCVSVLGFTANVLSRRSLVFILVIITSSTMIAELILSHNVWMVGDQFVVLARSGLAIVLLKKSSEITNARWKPYAIGAGFGLVSFIVTMWLREASQEQVSITVVVFLSISTAIATTGFYMRNVLLLKVFNLMSYIPWVAILFLRGLYGNLLGSFLSCSLIIWSLFEIWRARKRSVDFEQIEKANLPWKIRRLEGVSQ